VFGPVDLDRIANLAGDGASRQRLLALALMRRQIMRGIPPIDYLALARTLIEDPNNDCRWQALIVIGESVTDSPEKVWSIIRDYGASADQDLRSGVAVVLLEHLLQEHFEEYFPLVRAQVLRGSKRFAEMVGYCWFDGLQGSRYRRVQKLLRNTARGGFKCA
jgi:hypothetical protein